MVVLFKKKSRLGTIEGIDGEKETLTDWGRHSVRGHGQVATSQIARFPANVSAERGQARPGPRTETIKHK